MTFFPAQEYPTVDFLVGSREDAEGLGIPMGVGQVHRTGG